ncbi:hypothetical protein H0H81_003443 [Sphagnurus paluster]|uniref:Uncharacterized protein n=1 Tax=Sphagnurus paluster TaxID=117069 RepID=A0A9P7FSK8_9AGAR|nr:hypothetical protein H0H81_003443 [Sphagnurus paluster]
MAPPVEDDPMDGVADEVEVAEGSKKKGKKQAWASTGEGSKPKQCRKKGQSAPTVESDDDGAPVTKKCGAHLECFTTMNDKEKEALANCQRCKTKKTEKPCLVQGRAETCFACMRGKVSCHWNCKEGKPLAPGPKPKVPDAVKPTGAASKPRKVDDRKPSSSKPRKVADTKPVPSGSKPKVPKPPVKGKGKGKEDSEGKFDDSEDDVPLAFTGAFQIANQRAPDEFFATGIRVRHTEDGFQFVTDKARPIKQMTVPQMLRENERHYELKSQMQYVTKNLAWDQEEESGDGTGEGWGDEDSVGEVDDID